MVPDPEPQEWFQAAQKLPFIPSFVTEQIFTSTDYVPESIVGVSSSGGNRPEHWSQEVDSLLKGVPWVLAVDCHLGQWRGLLSWLLGCSNAQ